MTLPGGDSGVMTSALGNVGDGVGFSVGDLIQGIGGGIANSGRRDDGRHMPVLISSATIFVPP